MSDLLNTGLFVLNFARQATNGFLAGLEGDKSVKCFAEGGGNAAYIVGHIAFTDDMCLGMLAGKDTRMTDEQKKLFGGGAAPTESIADYPPMAEAVELMNSLREDLIAYFSSLSDAELTAPVEGDLAQFGDTRAKLMASLAWHEAMHAGQLTVLRRQFDMPRVFG